MGLSITCTGSTYINVPWQQETKFPNCIHVFKNWNHLMLVKDYISVSGFSTLFTLTVVFLIKFSSLMRHGFIWVVISTHIVIIKCGHPQNLVCTRKRAFIHWKRVYSVLHLIGKSSSQSFSTRQLLLKRRQIITDFITLLKHSEVYVWFQQGHAHLHAVWKTM